MFKIPPPLFGGSAERGVVISADTYIGNLWTYLGSPAGATNVLITVDGADAGDIQITADWDTGSTFTINCVNGGRVVGLGGDGGNGGSEFGESTGDPGDRGSDGGSAVSSDGFVVNVDVDDGYLLGGGGGGGGGSAYDDGPAWYPGGGGGGGQGFTDGTTTYESSGGAAGAGTPAATAGGDGDSTSPGTGGLGGNSPVGMGGGFGGTWGNSGNPGLSSDILGPNGFLYLYGGPGGGAGPAFDSINGGSINLTGAKSEATLRTEGRVRGETAFVSYRTFGAFRNASTFNPAPAAANITFGTDGDFTITTLPAPDDSIEWLAGTSSGIGNDYELRIYAPAASVQQDGVWDQEPAFTPGTWFSLGVARQFAMSVPSGTQIRFCASMVELRRVDDINGKPIGSFIIRCLVDTS